MRSIFACFQRLATGGLFALRLSSVRDSERHRVLRKARAAIAGGTLLSMPRLREETFGPGAR